MIDSWRVLDVTGWTEELPEERGTRAKVWLRAPDERRFLFKQPEARRWTETACEVLAQRIAGAVGLPAAETWPAIRLVVGQPSVQGLLSLDFTKPGDSLTAGAALMAQMDPVYDPKTQTGEHTLARVRAALVDREKRAPPAELALPFARMLLLDAWLGNGDRHPGNWSIIEQNASVRLAPIYDTASPFAPELHDGHVLVTGGHDYDVRLARYVRKCSSGFGQGGTKTVPQEQVLADLRDWPEYAAARELVDRFEELMQEELPAYIQQIPGEWLPPPRVRLTLDLLARRLNWLQERL